MSKWSSAYRDTRWYQLRNAVMERDNYTCQSCGAKGAGVVLNVHHAYYEAGKAPWEYDADTLVLLCDKCHESYHQCQKELMTRILDVVKKYGNQKNLFDHIIGFIDSAFFGAIRKENIHYMTGFTRAAVSDNASTKEIAKIVVARRAKNG